MYNINIYNIDALVISYIFSLPFLLILQHLIRLCVAARAAAAKHFLSDSDCDINFAQVTHYQILLLITIKIKNRIFTSLFVIKNIIFLPRSFFKRPSWNDQNDQASIAWFPSKRDKMNWKGFF